MINDSGSKPSLMFSNWPPVQRSTEFKTPPSLRQQILLYYRNTGRLPSNMFVKRYPTTMMRPMKMQSLKKAPVIPAPSYYKSNIQLPPRYRFRGSPSAPNTGEYIYENPFKNLGTQPVNLNFCFILCVLICWNHKEISYFIISEQKESEFNR